jgi:hypothetical protein
MDFRKLIRFKNKSQIKSIFIYNHLGLGDHIILNALIRNIVVINSDVCYSLFVKFRNFESVKFMFSDLPNLTFCVVNNDLEVLEILRDVPRNRIHKIGFDGVTNDFDICFYKQFNFGFENRFNSSILNRNTFVENNLYEKLNLEAGNYIFIHDDISRGLIIDETKFSNYNKIIIIRPFLTSTIFDWCKVLENALEIHCICSSFKALVDSLQLTNPKLFYHHTLSNSNVPRNSTFTTSNLPWKII